MKKLIRGLTVLTLSICIAFLPLSFAKAAEANADPIGTPYWPSFRGNPQNPGITDFKTPVSKNQTYEKWSADLKDSWCDPYPIIVGNYLYTVAGQLAGDNCTLQKRNLSDGKLVAETALFEGNGYFPYITYANGKFYVCVYDGRIEAFDAATLKPDWISEPLVDVLGEDDAYGLQSLAPVIYHDGYLYTGASEGDGSTGAYFCLSAEDGDCLTATDGSTYDGKKSYTMKKFKWVYVPKTGNKGFYWSGGAVANGAIIFGGDNGQLVAHSLTDDRVLDTLDLNTSGFDMKKNPVKIRSCVYYDKTTGRAFVTTRDNTAINSIKINADGTFDHSSLMRTVLAKDGGNLTSSPVVYNGRVYVGGGGMIADNIPFSVLDAATLKIIYQVPIHTQSTPVISTAYASPSNNNTVYIYVAKYSPVKENGISGDCIFCIKDFSGNTKADYSAIAAPDTKEYNTATLTVGPDGTLYYKNDSGKLFAFANKNSNGIDVSCQAHVQKLGWQNPVPGGEMSGTMGKNLRLEAIKFKLTGSLPSGASIIYQVHVQKLGWQNSVSNGAIAGTTGKGLRVEAFKMALRGLAGFKVAYRAYAQNLGWLDWQSAQNGTPIDNAAVAGTTGKNLGIEAIEVVLEKT